MKFPQRSRKGIWRRVKNCKKHKFGWYERRCVKCFDDMQEEMDLERQDFHQLNSEKVQLGFRIEKLEKILAAKLIKVVIDNP